MDDDRTRRALARVDEWNSALRFNGSFHADAVEHAMKELLASLALSRELRWVRSPNEMAGVLKDEKIRFGHQLRPQLGDQLSHQLWLQLGAQLWNQLRPQLLGQLRYQLWNQLRDQFRNQLWGQLGDQLWNYPRYDALWHALAEPPPLPNYWAPLLRATDAGLCFFIEREQDLLLLPQPRCVLDAQNRLHHESGPAIVWADDSREYFWRGVRVPPLVVEAPERLDIEVILHERNSEVRRIMLERFGYERAVASVPHRIVDDDPRHGTLYRLSLGEEELSILKVRDATHPEELFWLRVPSFARSAHEARAATFGRTPEEFHPLVET